MIDYEGGMSYSGVIKDGIPSGRGQLTNINGEEYVGGFISGSYHGSGRYSWADGQIFVGEYVNGAREGYGTVTFLDGSVYEGNLKQGNYEGKGTYIYGKGNEEDYSVRNAIEKWMNQMNGHVSNKGFSNNTDWVTDLELIQYSKDGESLMYYEFIDCWPQTLAEIPLSYDTASDIEQFDVTWAYNYYTTGDISDKIDNGNQD